MNFNYSYRAFLITCLLFGILTLTLWSIKIAAEVPQKLETAPIEYEDIAIEEPQEELAETTPEKVKIKTNRAYNEAEKFIKDLENERLEKTKSPETSPTQTSAINTGSTAHQKALSEAIKRLESQTIKSAETKESKSISSTEKGAITKTTIHYRLKNRTSIQLPNPVFTCENAGEIVITIRVNQLGKVIKTTFNKNASTTSNGCLIDSAIEYAQRARFNTKAGAEEQTGSITYHFPGQY